MEVLFSKPQLIDTFSSLGTIRGDVYMIGDKALGNLNDNYNNNNNLFTFTMNVKSI